VPDPGYAYLKNSQSLYDPKTPRTALRAVGIGLLPSEAFVYKANSIQPLFDEPVDIAAVERTLAKKNNDLATNVLLVRILERLLVDRDSETALFAAESINSIENIYNGRIEDLKEAFAEDNDPSHLRRIAQQFYEIGLINESRRGIKNFYLFEAYSYMRQYGNEKRLDDSDLKFIVRIMISLKSLELARSVIAQAVGRYPEDIDMLILAAEIEFHRRNYPQVYLLFDRLRSSWDKLPPHLQVAFEQWMARD
jgi:hypothetical protein